MPDKPKVLVVDDEPVIVESAAKTLSAEGYAVRTAAAAESALALLRAEAPDVVLIDLKLPALSGFDLLEVIRNEFPRVAAILMTGYATEENASTALEHGAAIFLPKPFTFEELLGAVERAAGLLKN
jgi:DNA-binding NtrC family response regulator